MPTISTRLVSAFTVALVGSALMAVPAHASVVTTTVDDISYSADDANVAAGASVTGYSGVDVDIIIPATVDIGPNTYDVTSIADNAFQAKGLTSVVIPSSVSTISSQAFYGNSLTTLVLPEGVTSVGLEAFAANGITSLTLPNSLTTMGYQAFYGNSLTALAIPTGLNTIGEGAFGANSLTSLELPANVTAIDAYAFANNDLTTLAIPNTVTTIGQSAFLGNDLTSVTLPNGITTISNQAFDDNKLASVTIPNGVTTIGDSAFRNNLLTSVTIPDSVASIDAFAFRNNALTSVTIPASVTGIGTGAFYDNALTSAVFLGDEPTTSSAPLGDVAGSNDPLVSYYARNTGFGSPTWTAGGRTYRSQALATVTFNANGYGTAPAATDVVVGANATAPANPSATGYTFDGWFTAASGGTEFDFSSAVSADVTLYAQWTAVGGLAATGPNSQNTHLWWIAALLIAIGATMLTAGTRRR